MLKLTTIPPGLSIGFRLLIGAVISYFAIHNIYTILLHRNNLNRGPGAYSSKPLQGSENDSCAGLDTFDRVVITVKTGATEAIEKVPVQLQSTFRCVPAANILFFSDMGQQIEGHEVLDALDTIPAAVKDGNSDFDIYRKQQILQDPAKIASILKDMKDPRRPEDLAAWTLDKYKNMHIVEKALALRPDADWYLHLDADSYVIWPSLVEWIQRLDASKEYFLGSLAYMQGSRPFAHGGSGLLLSKPLTNKLIVEHNETLSRWDAGIHDECCGDFALAEVLRVYGTSVMNAWPTINGETPSTIPFADDHWCQPLVTLHHIAAADAENLTDFEQKRCNKTVCFVYNSKTAATDKGHVCRLQ